MVITLKCTCGERLKVSHKQADQKQHCPACQKAFRVPKAKFVAAAKKAKAKRAAQVAAATNVETENELPTAAVETEAPSGFGDDFLEDLSLSTDTAPAEPEFDENAAVIKGSVGPVVYAGGVSCPACQRSLPPNTQICVDCGINVQTGRSLITTDDGRLDEAYGKAHEWARWLSWIMPIGIYPFASEAFGTKEPWVIRATAVITILVTVWVWTADWSNSPKMQSRKQLMLWPSDPKPHAGLYQYFLVDEHYGDLAAFDAAYEALAAARREANKPDSDEDKEPEADEESKPVGDEKAIAPEPATPETPIEEDVVSPAEPTSDSEPPMVSIIVGEDGEFLEAPEFYSPVVDPAYTPPATDEPVLSEEEAMRQAFEQFAADAYDDDDDAGYFYGGPPEGSDELDYELWFLGSPDLRSRLGRDDDLVIEAHNALPVHQRGAGAYRPYQLFTNAFLHGGIFHLGGNLLFLLVFGTRVNAAIGWWRMLIIYPILAIGASLIYLVSERGGLPIPALGASGAIMGLAGMYLVLFPVHKMHMVGWVRMGLMWGFRLGYKTWEVRGFWVVLFYIAFDVVAVVLRSEDGVAHWAHLGGFIVGSVLALLLLIARLINGRGADLFSVILGQKAWALIGKPRTT